MHRLWTREQRAGNTAGVRLGRAVVVLAAVVAVGCVTQAAPDPVVLRVLMADDWAGTAPVLDTLRAFEADHPGVTVNLIGRPFSQIDGEIATAAAAGAPFDVAQSHAFAVGAIGLAEPLDDLWTDRLSPGDYFPGAIDDVTWGDTVYGVPLDINAMFLVLDADVVAEVGLPTTFPDVARLARHTADHGGRGTMITSSSWLAYGWIRANGGEIVEVAPDGTPTFTLDRAENVEALDFLAGLIEEGVAYGPTTRNVADDAFTLFATGETSMLATGTWDAVALRDLHPDLEFVTAPMPGGTHGTTAGSALGGSSLLVGAGTPHRELAIEFVLALTEPDVALELARTEGRLPPTPELLARAGLDPALLATMDQQLRTAHPQRLIAFPEAQEAFARALDEVLSGRQNAAAALAEAQRVAERTGQ